MWLVEERKKEERKVQFVNIILYEDPKNKKKRQCGEGEEGKKKKVETKYLYEIINVCMVCYVRRFGHESFLLFSVDSSIWVGTQFFLIIFLCYLSIYRHTVCLKRPSSFARKLCIIHTYKN